MADWFRSWHGAPTDAKWRTVAKRAKVAPSLVVAVAWALMDRASQNNERGSIDGIDVETLADFFDCKPESIERIIAAMREKCVLTDQHFTAWERRQPVREDGSAERARAWREAQKRNQQNTERKAPAPNEAERIPPLETGDERERTQPNTNEHREEESRLDTDQNSAATRARDPGWLDRLQADLRIAAGLEDESSPGLFDLSPILALAEAGFDIGTEILPVIRAKRRKGIRSWNYFVPMVHESRDSRAAAAPRPSARDGPTARPTRGVASALAGLDSFYGSRQDD